MTDENALAQACDAASKGRFGEAVLVPASAPVRTRVLAHILACHRWQAGVGPPVVIADEHAMLGAPRGCELLMRWLEVAALRLDAPAVQRLASTVDDIRPRDAREQVWLELARAFAALCRGHELPEPQLAELERRAREGRCAEQVLGAATLRVFAAADDERPYEAIEHARRAFRMARTEGLPQAEYRAGWALARQRRLAGRPYLATRILVAQRGYAPSSWHPWIDVERILANGPVDGVSSQSPVEDLVAVLDAARLGDAPGFSSGVARALQALAAFAPLRGDVLDAVAALGGSELGSPRAAVAAWCDGQQPFGPAPGGLAGLAGVPLAAVVGRPRSAGRRLLGLGIGLLGPDVDRGPLSDKPGRTESLLAALALAGPAGLPEEDLFSVVYGFSYNPALHRGAWDVALHRARTGCADVGVLHRSEGRVGLEVKRPFVVPDPRCQRSHEDRVLQRIAAESGSSARDLAGALGLSLRTVQDALRELVNVGACRQHRDGRRVIYSVEDTTFQEPTLA